MSEAPQVAHRLSQSPRWASAQAPPDWNLPPGALAGPGTEQLILSPQPLNPNPDSRWNTYFKDNEVLLQIDKDVR